MLGKYRLQVAYVQTREFLMVGKVRVYICETPLEAEAAGLEVHKWDSRGKHAISVVPSEAGL